MSNLAARITGKTVTGKEILDNYYVFYYIESHDAYVYERTCGDLEGARERVALLESRDGRIAMFMLNNLPKKFFY